jgi:hypothetical protein
MSRECSATSLGMPGMSEGLHAKMVVWCPRLNMYLLLRLQWWTAPLPHLRRLTKIEEKLLLRGR